MKSRRLSACLAGLFIALALTEFAAAQATISYALLNGTVTDESGRTIAHAAITLRSLDTNQAFTAVSSEAGFYALPNLPPGRYELTVSSAGFGKYTRTGMELTVGQAANVNVTMKVAAVREEVVVSTEAPTVETTRSEVSQVIDTKQINDLPISGRLFTDFALLAPSVATSRTALGTTFTEFEVTQISFGGQRSFSNEITVDGADFVNTITGVQRATPPQDSVQEFRVVNNSFGAEYGRALGGIVNIVTRSGSNQMHGSVYDYLQNSATDARSLLQPAPLPHALRRESVWCHAGRPGRQGQDVLFSELRRASARRVSHVCPRPVQQHRRHRLGQELPRAFAGRLRPEAGGLHGLAVLVSARRFENGGQRLWVCEDRSSNQQQ